MADDPLLLCYDGLHPSVRSRFPIEDVWDEVRRRHTSREFRFVRRKGKLNLLLCLPGREQARLSIREPEVGCVAYKAYRRLLDRGERPSRERIVRLLSPPDPARRRAQERAVRCSLAERSSVGAARREVEGEGGREVDDGGRATEVEGESRRAGEAVLVEEARAWVSDRR